MKKNLVGLISLAALLATPLASSATVFFADNFTTSTVTNLTPGTPTASSTDYEVSSSKAWNPEPSIVPGHLVFGITNSTAGGAEIQARFPLTAMVIAGDYIQLSVTFTDTQGLLTQNSFLGLGMFNSGGSAPIGGGLNGTATTAASDVYSGGVQNWQGYLDIIGFTGQSCRFVDRQMQTGTANNNQNLTSNASSSQSYRNPAGGNVGGTATTNSVTLTAGAQYTEILTYTLLDTGAIQMTNQLYTGTDNTGTLLSTWAATTGTTPLTTGFDGIGFGFRCTGGLTNTLIDVNAITVSGSVTAITGPPHIDTQPAAVVVASGGAGAFSVAATGFGMTYQWHRDGTNLIDGGNISGSTTSQLEIAPAGPSDVLSVANGYSVTVTGIGPYSTNSITNSLTIVPSTNLTWTGAAGGTWDLDNTASWKDPGGNAAVFTFGDPVSLSDGPSLRTITLSGSYLSAGSLTMNASVAYTLQGSGSFAGPGKLIYSGSGLLDINNANTYTGGTIISNSGAYLYLENQNGLGSGPVTLAKAGGTMEVYTNGGPNLGIQGDIIVNDDFTIQFDGNGAYSGVIFGNLSGISGKTLTLTPQYDGSTNRFRVYGNNTVCDAYLVLNGTATSQANYLGTCLAPYNSSGSQTYNGVISGNGGLVQRDNGVTILNGQNTYVGGTTPTTGIIAFGADTVGTVTSGPIGTGPLFLSPEIPNAAGNGQVMAWGGAHTIANPLEYPSATNNLTLLVGGTNALTFSGPITLNGLDGLGTFTNRIFNVTNTALTTFSGVVSDGGNMFGLVKSGNGILALANTETYTGSTVVSNGTLWVNGQLNASSVVTVATNGALGGTGTVNGAVTVNVGGALAPGATSIGTLNLASSLALNGDVHVRVNRSGLQSDYANVSGARTSGGTGTVLVNNTGATLHTGDTFTLFSGSVTGAGTMKVVGGGVGWNNQLGVNGTIVVSSTNLPVITASYAAPTLTLSWPSAYLGWQLQSNSVSLTSTNWFTVPNSGNAASLAITRSSNRTNVFYRLIQP